KAVGVLGVRVPHRVVDRVVTPLARPVDMHQPNPGLDQAPGQKEAGAPLARPVTLAKLRRLLREIKRRAGRPRAQQAERILGLAAVQVKRPTPLQPVEVLLHLCQYRSPRPEPKRWYILGKRQSLDVETRVRGIADHPLGIPALAQETRRLTRGLDVVVQ